MLGSVRTREAQGESRERIAAALAAAGTGTFRWDVETDIVEWDDTLGRLFGLSTRSPSRSLEFFLSAVHSDDRPSVADMYRRSARTGAALDMEFRVVWPDGSVHWLTSRGAFIVITVPARTTRSGSPWLFGSSTW